MVSTCCFRLRYLSVHRSGDHDSKRLTPHREIKAFDCYTVCADHRRIVGDLLIVVDVVDNSIAVAEPGIAIPNHTVRIRSVQVDVLNECPR